MNDQPIGLLYLLSGAGPVAVAVVGWLLKRWIGQVDASILEAKDAAGDAQEAADGANAIAATAMQRVEVMQAGGPYQTAGMCAAMHRQEEVHHANLLTTVGEIKALLQGQRQEDRADRERLWTRVDDLSGRVQVVETLMQRKRGEDGKPQLPE